MQVQTAIAQRRKSNGLHDQVIVLYCQSSYYLLRPQLQLQQPRMSSKSQEARGTMLETTVITSGSTARVSLTMLASDAEAYVTLPKLHAGKRVNVNLCEAASSDI